MRVLYLLRHAKSSWDDASLRDFDRPLKKRGRTAAERIGRELAAEKPGDLLVVCSPAVRARETAQIVLKSARIRSQELFDKRIYEASLGDLRQVVAELPDEKRSVILIGHNPGFEELLAFLTGRGMRVPTCTLAKIGFEAESWKDVKTGAGTLERFVTPKGLAED